MKSTKPHTDFASIVERHQEKVRNTCFRFVRNREDADDVSQEVFIQVYESLDHFREEAELSTWIYRIAVNKSLDFIRREKRKKRFAHLTSLFGRGEGRETMALSAGDDPQRDVEQAERKQVLDRALESLPDNQRTAITLSKYEEFSNKEIASIMGLSVQAVEALTHRAKENLRKRLYEYFEKKV